MEDLDYLNDLSESVSAGSCDGDDELDILGDISIALKKQWVLWKN